MENAILVGLDTGGKTDITESLLELGNLARACDVNVLYTIIQKRDTPTANFYIGEGKVEEVLEAVNTLDADLVIFNDELSPSHIRNLENSLKVKVIDRTVLILDIFAKRAKTKEAMLQVELAQAKYFMPRVVGMYKYLSRQKSGTGSKGPGEQQLELDRRLLRSKITKLKRELNQLVKVRRTQRNKRKSNNIKTVALTGYTNAGKSTLMNAIVDYSSMHNDRYAFEQNMLFATLETKTRKINFENNREYLITDTVGFIDKLPHHLVESFKSTLEEIAEASLILHVIDASNPNYEDQIDVVEDVLEDIGIHEIPVIYVFNKNDIAKRTNHIAQNPSIFISALNGENIDKLVEMIDKILYNDIIRTKMFLPFEKGDIYSKLKDNSNIIDTEYKDDGILIDLEIKQSLYNKYKKYVI
ncbi:GTPase HflX [Candidatus Izemoplasma sp. B36]|uniref:GTPase HflX n=1 Tax=Candidatus Izemoplasma sp. B36 TaxID=3242468 RepID=UPI003558F315